MNLFNNAIPCSSGFNIHDVPLRYPELYCNPRFFTAFMSYCYDLFSAKLRSPSPFFVAVGYIIFLRAKKQMRRVYTGLYVAFMQNAHIYGYLSVVNFPRITVRAALYNFAAARINKSAVTLAALCPAPKPASFGIFFYLRPKASFCSLVHGCTLFPISRIVNSRNMGRGL